MEYNDYKKQLENLEHEYKKAKNELHIKYGLSQAKFKVGDRINNYLTNVSLCIDEIDVTIGNNNEPIPVYKGFELNKNLSQKQNKNRTAIYGNYMTSLLI